MRLVCGRHRPAEENFAKNRQPVLRGWFCLFFEHTLQRHDWRRLAELFR